MCATHVHREFVDSMDTKAKHNPPSRDSDDEPKSKKARKRDEYALVCVYATDPILAAIQRRTWVLDLTAPSTPTLR